jgi:N-ethylmaleimide reductase
VVETRIKGIEEIAKGRAPIAPQHLRPKFSGTLIAAGGFGGDSAAAIVAAGDVDLVAFRPSLHLQPGCYPTCS